ncbi:4Fe-4S binding protein [candidate division KSB1 bacterium]
MFNSYKENSLVFIREKCNDCIMCSIVCPLAVFKRENNTVELVSPQNCIECGACALNCPKGAITVDSGVGCASLLIVQALKGEKEPACSEETGSCCGD